MLWFMPEGLDNLMQPLNPICGVLNMLKGQTADWGKM